MTTQPPSYGQHPQPHPPQSPYGQQPYPHQHYPPAGYPQVPHQRLQHPTNAPVHLPPSPPKNGLGTAGFVLGLIALVLSFIPIIGVIALPLSIIGLILGSVGTHRASKGEATNKGLAIAGIATSVLALLICMLWAAAFGNAVDDTRTSASNSTSASQSSALSDSAETAAPAGPVNAGPTFPGKKDGDIALAAGGTVTFDGLAVTSTPLRAGDSTFEKTLCTTVSYANGGTSTASFSVFDFELQDPAGAILSPTFFGGGKGLDTGELAPGGKVSGDVCFEDKARTNGVYVVLEPNMFVSERGAFTTQR
ncbi:hypothetical protein GCM10010472_03190 [Pseudonocardia halophobica]|uniref:DUF4352 domain-containing protein n=1 Tax=Pseudonocardia halophobica TaxID=29401 RepID=A0A9W6L3Y7_9PSEU|nr:DUF4190 domain-containing protein [Pseudonocardia halophobica]GLL10659.1 hypothetical protein GCM10017577_17990 [Pseudonocardia halophobica]